VPNFERFVRLFWNEVFGLGVCGSNGASEGTIKSRKNSDGSDSYAKYKCKEGKWVLIRACGDLWCGAKRDAYVNTGIADNSGDKGYWWETNGYGGHSSYPGNVNLKDGFLSILNSCDGICAQYTLSGGSMSEPTLFEIGFNMTTGYDVSKDVSSWEGVCVSYQSDRNLAMLLDGDSKLHGSDVPKVVLPKSEEGTVLNFSWKDFKQDGWGNKIEGEKMALQTTGMGIWNLNGSSSELSGSFVIYGLGRRGTCK
jgi:hypothetical protein